MSIDEKVRILSAAKKSVLAGFTKLVKTKGYDVHVEPGVLRMIAERCPEETGARALHALCTELFTNLEYDLKKYACGQKIIVTEDVAESLMKLYKNSGEKSVMERKAASC